jgi:hypothetical protein
MEKTLTINFSNLIGAIIAFTVAFLTAQGTLQNYTSFAGPANEMGFCFMAFFLGVILTICSFSKPSK